MPLTSQVGRDQVISSTVRPLSPAGTERPTAPRKALASNGSFSHCARSARGQLGHAVVEAGERHAAVGVAQVGEDAGEDVVGVGGGRAVEAGMQVAVGGRGSRSPRRTGRAASSGSPASPASHMLVSQIRPMSARSSSAWALRNGGRLTPPDSSSPSSRIETGIGSLPATAFQARQASTKVISWPLSSEAPRPRIARVPSGRVSMNGSKGSWSQSSSGSTGCTS